MKRISVAVILTVLLSCNKTTVVDITANNGVSIGINVVPTNTCLSQSGHKLEFFKDYNNDNQLNGLDYIVKVVDVCDGQSVSVEPASTLQCPAGGVVVNNLPVCNGLNAVLNITSSTSCPAGGININGHDVCNGISPILSILPATPSQCLMGGIVINGHVVCNGLNGVSAVLVKSVKLCPADTDPYAEHGIIIGNDLYGVLYSNQSSHPHQIGLVKMNPGNWVTTTTGSSKSFTYTKTTTHIILSCNSVTESHVLN